MTNSVVELHMHPNNEIQDNESPGLTITYTHAAPSRCIFLLTSQIMPFGWQQDNA